MMKFFYQQTLYFLPNICTDIFIALINIKISHIFNTKFTYNKCTLLFLKHCTPLHLLQSYHISISIPYWPATLTAIFHFWVISNFFPSNKLHTYSMVYIWQLTSWTCQDHVKWVLLESLSCCAMDPGLNPLSLPHSFPLFPLYSHTFPHSQPKIQEY